MQVSVGFEIRKTQIQTPVLPLSNCVSWEAPWPLVMFLSLQKVEPRKPTLQDCGKVSHSDPAWHLVGAHYSFPMINFRSGGSRPWLLFRTALLRNRHAWKPPGKFSASGSGVGPRHPPSKKPSLVLLMSRVLVFVKWNNKIECKIEQKSLVSLVSRVQ